MLVEVAGGGPVKKRILKKYFTSFPCCLVFQKPVLSTGTTLQQPPFHGSSPHPGGLGSFLLFSHPPHPPGPCKEASPTHLPPPILQRKPWPAAASSLVSHFLSVPLVSFPHTARGKSLLRIKSPGGFPGLRIKSKHLDGGPLSSPHPTSHLPCTLLPCSHTDLLAASS